jgi:predicted MPP superfamily phosphohydrolase
MFEIPNPTSKITRRTFLRAAAATPLLAFSGAAAYARLIEPYTYIIAHHDIFIRDLPDSFQGFRIAHITDVHHSNILGIEEVQRVVQLAGDVKPDLIALTGDYTTSFRRYIEPCAEALGKLEAPEGVWAVLGNHDHYTDPELTTRALERNHIRVLNNANTILRRGSDTLQLSGIDDWSWAATNWSRAFQGLDLQRPSVLLSHQPGVLDVAESQGASLILSGHTHGGQIDLPLLGAPARLAVKDLKYARGLFRRGNTQLYVSTGTGVIGLPVRFRVRPEIAILTLRREGRQST